MRNVAAIPAGGLLAGAAIGLAAPDLPPAFPFTLLIGAAATAAVAWWRVRPPLLMTMIIVVFAAGGLLLAADAWNRAWRPTLRVAFEGLARSERVEAAAEGRRVPQDDEAFAIVTGTLRA